MNILYIGDIMAEPGIRVVENILSRLIAEKHIDFVVAQAENVTAGKGMSIEDYERLRRAGVNAFTGGNHTVVRHEISTLLEDPSMPVVGPANMHDCPGLKYKLIPSEQGTVLIASILGNIVGKQAEAPVDNPLKTIDDILSEVPRESYVAAVVNIHGDFSSEKVVFGHYVDGRVSMAVGDHWHVATVDAEVLPKGTAHITDVGMCGALDSSLGVTFDSIIPRWRDGYQTRNELETSGRMQFSAVLADVDETNGRARSIEQIRDILTM